MTGFSDYFAQNGLNYVVGKTAMPTLPTVSVALFTAVGTDAGTGFTEVTGGSYARVTTSGATWNASSGTAPSIITNSASITFPTATANWGTVIAFGLYDAATVGNLLAWDFIGNFSWLPFESTSVNTGNGPVFTAKANGFANSDPLVATIEYGGTFPTLTTGVLTAYNVFFAANVATDTFTATTTAGGTAFAATTTGSGQVRKIIQQSIPNGIQASFAGGAFTITSA